MALANTTPARCCIIVQQELENIMGSTAPGSIMEPTGMLNALLSPLNTNGFEAVAVDAFPGKGLPSNGVKPKVEIRYKKPVCGDADETAPDVCTEGDNAEDPWGYQEFNIPASNVLSKSFTVSQSQFDAICEGRDMTIAEHTRDIMKILRNSLEKKMISILHARAGNYVEGINSLTDPKTLLLYGVVDGQPYANPAAFLEVKSQYRRMYSDLAPIVVGGDALARYFDMRNMAGLGQQATFADPNNMGGLAPFTSLMMDSVLNPENEADNHLLSWLPGTAQLVTWNLNRGEREFLNHPNTVRTTMEYQGLTYDYTMHFDDCTLQWTITASIYYDLFSLPVALQGSCYNWNYILSWLADCGDSTCANLNPTLPT